MENQHYNTDNHHNEVIYMEFVSGGVCAPQGFTANGVSCGLRADSQRRDLALVVSSVPAVASGVFSNAPQTGACVQVSRDHLRDHQAQAILCNSGITSPGAKDDLEVARTLCGMVNHYTGIHTDNVVLSSVGPVGNNLDLKKVSSAMHNLYNGRSRNGGTAADAIITRDTYKKETAVFFELNGVKCTLGAMAKGCSMEKTDMANFLCFLTTDVAIVPELLDKAMNRVITRGFNMISMDRIAGPNDMAVILANGLADNEPIAEEGPAYDLFLTALEKAVAQMCRLIAGDGEGATKLLECRVAGAAGEAEAASLAKTVAAHPGVRRMLYRGEADLEALTAALGAAGEYDVSLSSAYGTVKLLEQGKRTDFDQDLADQIFMGKEIDVIVTLNQGSESATAWGCDRP